MRVFTLFSVLAVILMVVVCVLALKRDLSMIEKHGSSDFKLTQGKDGIYWLRVRTDQLDSWMSKHPEYIILDIKDISDVFDVYVKLEKVK